MTNMKISELDLKNSLDGSEEWVINDGGINKKASTDGISAYATTVSSDVTSTFLSQNNASNGLYSEGS